MKYNRICLMVPTYKRVSNGKFPRFVESAIQNASSHKRICLCACVNKRDTETLQYIERMRSETSVEIDVITENLLQPNLAYYFNKMYDETKFNDQATLVSMLGDDMIFQTPDYDIAILQMLNNYDGNGLVWCNDDYIAKDSLCVNLFTTRKYVEAIEKPFMCPLFHADMIDVVWMVCQKMTGSGHYLKDVVIKHDHGTAYTQDQWDENFCRLSPLRTLNSGQYKQRQAGIWAHIMASNLVKNGLAKWIEKTDWLVTSEAA